jgi:acetyltransferase-like isoleucine patch superfamily enzyme
MKIGIFGACREGIDAYRSIFASLILDNNVEFIFYDNDSRLIGSSFEAWPIYKPDSENINDVTIMIICIIDIFKVRDQLLDLGFKGAVKEFYSRDCFSNETRRIGLATIGAYSYFKPSTILYNTVIGNYCHIGADCRLGLIGHEPSSLTTYPLKYKTQSEKSSNDVSQEPTAHRKRLEPLVIENDVYIGEGVTIMSGLVVGSGSVIGSRSVVTQNLPPFSIAVGSPAKVINLRLKKSAQDKLYASEWWLKTPEEALKILENIS